MAEKFFYKIADDVLQATEQIQARMEEGLNLLWTGDVAEKASLSHSMGGDSDFLNEGNMDNLDLENLSEEEIQKLLAEEMMDSNPLQGIADSVMGNIMSGQVGPQTPMEHFDAFRSAIRWSEKFIIGLLTFQMIMFLLCLYVSRRDRGLTPRICMLVFIGAVVRSSEWLNELGARHWETFATQDYFDKRGVFVGIMLSGPLLLDSLMMLFMFVSEAGSLLIQVKKEELKRKKKKQEEAICNSGSKRSKTKKQD